MAKKLRVFVYGTLNRGRSNHGALEGSTLLGRATIKGPCAFVNLGWYPCVIENEQLCEREIGGEVYEIDNDTLATLDLIEGHPSYYERKKITTSLGCKAWVYTLPNEYLDRARVADLFWNQSPAEEEWISGRNEAAA